MGITANDERGKSRRRFESCHFRVTYDNREILLEELEILERLKIITLRRTLNAGLLVIPDGLEPLPADWDEECDEDDKSFEDMLVEAMLHPVRDPDSPGTIVPIILRGPADLVQHVRLIKFDDHMIDIEDIEKRIEAIKGRLDQLDTGE